MKKKGDKLWRPQARRYLETLLSRGRWDNDEALTLVKNKRQGEKKIWRS